MSTILIPEHYDEKLSVICSPKDLKGGGLFLGNEDGARDRDMLRKKRITAVLTISSEIDINFKEMSHLHIKIFDSPFEDIYSHFPKCFDFIGKHMEKGNVFVHCQMGISRSATVVIGYLMLSRGLTLPKALEKVQNKRSIVRPNAGFMMQLGKLQCQLQKSKPPGQRRKPRPNSTRPK